MNGGRAFSISNAKLGELQTSAFGVQGTDILLHNEECAAGGTERFYENEYSYTLAGKTLTFTTVKNQCRDHVAQTILTSEPWTKTGR